MARILVVATYPIKNPQHGGQKRTDAIVSNYRKNFKSVRFVAVFFRDFYKYYSSSDIPLSVESEQLVRQSPLTGDIVCGNAIYQDAKVKRKFTRLLQEYKPDIIHLEQPFSFLGLKPLLSDLDIHPKIIFGSQNIEAPMKREILENAGADEKEIVHVENTIKRLETELSQSCDLLAVCTESDMKEHQKMGAKRIVLAPNGVATNEATPDNVHYWKRLFSEKGIENKVLFVGSAHPPNWVGFVDMIGKGLGFVPYTSRIVLAGSICDYFEREIDPLAVDIQDATFWLRAYSAGRLSEERLVALLEVSDVIVLPITEGGGSNLKTAEAILTNKKVVATSHALRSFEWFKEFPNVWVADTAEAFREAVVKAIDATFEERTESQKKKAKDVLWRNCLAGLMQEAKQL
jgi:glycosyltransferase involved in cell wall biosynthesis